MSGILRRAFQKWLIAMAGAVLAMLFVWAMTALAHSHGYVIIVRPSLSYAFMFALVGLVIYRVLWRGKR